MKAPLKFTCIVIALFAPVLVLSSFWGANNTVNRTGFSFPYRSGGLTERQAAAHLLNRFTYGATPGQIDEVLKMGPENWFSQQLSANLPDDSLNSKLNN